MGLTYRINDGIQVSRVGAIDLAEGISGGFRLRLMVGASKDYRGSLVVDHYLVLKTNGDDVIVGWLDADGGVELTGDFDAAWLTDAGVMDEGCDDAREYLQGLVDEAFGIAGIEA